MGVDRIAMLKYACRSAPAVRERRALARHYGFKPLDVPTLAGIEFVTDPIIPEAYGGCVRFGSATVLIWRRNCSNSSQGRQDATCSTRMSRLSTPGERWIVLDGRRDPRCVSSQPKSSSPLQRSRCDFAMTRARRSQLAYWREAHRSTLTDGQVHEDMMLMCERFRLVEIFAARRVVNSLHALSFPPPCGEGQGGGIPGVGVMMVEQKTPTWKVPSKLAIQGARGFERIY